MRTGMSSRQCRVEGVEANGTMLALHVQFKNSTLRGAIKRLRFPLEGLLAFHVT